MRPGITFTYMGVAVNDRAQVLMQDGKPAANLFAAGEIMAGNILGQGYLGGIGMTIGGVFGRIAGAEAARVIIDNLEADGFDLKTLLDPKASQEVARVMQICNACRYCEGFCAVFPAMTRRRHFNEGDVGYLSNLCHNCGACYHACQYAPPHEFGVNVPQAFAAARNDSYAAYAWPDHWLAYFAKMASLLRLVFQVASR